MRHTRYFKNYTKIMEECWNVVRTWVDQSCECKTEGRNLTVKNSADKHCPQLPSQCTASCHLTITVIHLIQKELFLNRKFRSVCLANHSQTSAILNVSPPETMRYFVFRFLKSIKHGKTAIFI